MDKNKFAQTPPMGWNSYDYYDTSVNEEQVKANADYMAAHLKLSMAGNMWWWISSGMRTVGSMRDKHQYIPFSKLEWTNTEDCSPVLSVFPRQRAERASGLWRITYTAWG